MQQKSFFKTGKGIALLGFIIVTLLGIPFTVLFLQQQQVFSPHAWVTTQSASATCDATGKAVITAKFSNTEPAGAANAMKVTVKDAQSGVTIDLGVINPGETKTGDIQTGLTSLTTGGVLFTLKWADGHSGTDTRTATYPAVTTCVASSDTPTNTPPVSSDTPTDTPPVTSDTPTDTPPVASDTPTNTPPVVTDTTGPSQNPTATPTTPPPGSTNTPTVVPVTIAPTGPSNLLVGFGAVSVLLTVVGGLVFILL